MIQQFLSVADQDRALRSLQKLARHDVSRWALTGGVALGIHRVLLRGEPAIPTLNDLDFIVDSFDCIPETLANDFLFRHIHPFDTPGKTMLQFVDSDSALRMDPRMWCDNDKDCSIGSTVWRDPTRLPRRLGGENCAVSAWPCRRHSRIVQTRERLFAFDR